MNLWIKKIIVGFYFFIALPFISQAHEGTNLFIGPEVYYVSRIKDGGAKQTGTLYGVRIGYEKLKRYKFYYAVDGLYSQGVLEGKTADHHIRSEFTNSNIETRFGYTFQSKCFPYISLTPFFGIGYMWEINHYRNPSPIKVKFDNSFHYLPFGCLLSFNLSEMLQVGINATARFLWNGKQTVKDPDYGKLSQCYEEHIQYRIEMPISYWTCWNSHQLKLRLTPFYEYRHYGNSINFPFDYLDTKFKFYGANLEAIYSF